MPTLPPEYEVRRLQVLRSYQVLGTPEEQEFDDITALAAQICGTPMALITLVDESSQWFKAKVGLEATGTPREHAFCTHALQQRSLLVVPDATRDERFANNPLVTGEPSIRFYAGAPLVAPGGEVLGTLCVIDQTVRELTPLQTRALTLLAREVMTHLELRMSVRILKASEARYRQLFEQNPHPMWAYDPDTSRFLAVNDAAVVGYGYTREEFLGMKIQHLAPGDGRSDRPGIVRHQAKDGREIAVEITSNPMDFDGASAQLVLAMDVTGKLAAEDALRASEVLQRQTADSQAAILNALPAHIALLDADGCILAVNESWRHFAATHPGHSQQYAVGGNYLNACESVPGKHAEDAARIAAGIRAVLAGELPDFGLEYPYPTPDGMVWLRQSTTLFMAGSGEGAVVMHVNITERKLAEAALEKANSDLREASRLAGMADVATHVLHNVGNVLNSVNVSCAVISDKVSRSCISSVARTSALLQEHQADLVGFFATDPRGRGLPEFIAGLAARLADEQATVLGEIRSLADHIEHINEVVSLQQQHATGRVGVLEVVSIADTVEEALKMSDLALTDYGIVLIREFDEGRPAPLERHKVVQILVNLFRNAQQAVLAGCGRRGGEIVVRIDERGGRRSVSVSDNGVGIARENLTRIFAQGFTTNKTGHGLGLHSSAIAAREMGGSLTVHSEGSGLGANFTLSLKA